MGIYEVIQKLEAMRKKKNLYGALTMFCVIAPTFLMIFSGMMASPILSMFIMVGGVCFFASKSTKITKEYKRIYKDNFVVNVLNEVFDNVVYNYEDGFRESHVRSFGLTRLGNRFRSEDYLRASYKGINFEQADVVIEYHSSGKNSHTTTYFRGRMFAFDFPYKQVSSVQVFDEKYPYRATPGQGLRMNKIQMESTAFNKEFDVLAVNDMDAFFVLTPQMMEKIQSLRQHYGNIAMHFCGKKLYVGVLSGVDAFDGDVRREINYVEEREATLRDAQVITGIIDVLGLMKKEEDGDDFIPVKEKPSDSNNVDNTLNEIAMVMRDRGFSEGDIDRILSSENHNRKSSSILSKFTLKM